MEDGPSTFPNLDVQLEYMGVDDNNNLYVRLRFADGAEWDIEWAPDSSEAREIFDFFSRLATQTISRVGGRGLTITNVTPIEQEDD